MHRHAVEYARAAPCTAFLALAKGFVSLREERFTPHIIVNCIYEVPRPLFPSLSFEACAEGLLRRGAPQCITQ